jgi:uncharacterized protein YbaA (DUF1428 family)
MTVIDGCVLAVPNDAKDKYIAYAQKLANIFKEYGALSVVEGWGVDVPDGKVTSFPMAVKLEENETVVFSWVVWPNKEKRDKAWDVMMKDPRLEEEPMPFDGKRMIFGLYENVLDIEPENTGTFIDGFLVPCAESAKQAYIDYAKVWAPIFQEYGALAMSENWSIETPPGEVTSVPMAIKQEEGEGVLFSWIYWPDKATRDTNMEKMMKDPRMSQAEPMPFDGKRMIYGGFEKVVSA